MNFKKNNQSFSAFNEEENVIFLKKKDVQEIFNKLFQSILRKISSVNY